MKVCSICARGGSKGVKNKNIRSLLGLPLIAHTLRQAIAAKCFDVIAVSSDSPAILAVAKKHGATDLIQRPIELARDRSPKLPAIQHCVRAVEERRGRQATLVVDLDASAPLRSVEHITGAIRLLRRKQAHNVITGVPARRSPYFNLVEVSPEGWARLAKTADRPVSRRQDCPPCYDMNASIYVWSRASLFDGGAVFHPRTVLYAMPEYTAFDIDSELDFAIVKLIKRHHQI